jgi:hypothetical protein
MSPRSQPSRPQRILAGAVALVIAIALWVFAHRQLSPREPREAASPAPPASPSPLAPREPPAREAAPSVLPQTALREAEACFPGISSKLRSARSQETEWENIHYELSDGSRRRLRREGRELKLYAEDAEGLPVPLEFDGKTLPEGRVVFRERSVLVEVAGSIDASYVERDGGLTRLVLTTPDGSLRCEEDEASSRTECSCSFNAKDTAPTPR